MTAADSAKRMLRRVGIEVSRSPAPNTVAWQLRQIVRLRQIDGVVDVGGHHGEFVTMMRDEVSYRGRIVSFEPSAANSISAKNRAWTVNMESASSLASVCRRN